MLYHVDGYMLGSNPSDIGGGYTIWSEEEEFDDFENKQKVHFFSKDVLKKGMTNNETELLAVLNCVRLAEPHSLIYTDSMNTIYWCKNGKSKARPDLNELLEEAKRLIEMKNIELLWICRDMNKAGVYNEYVLKHK
jgi:ribonuclease HI